ncbi:MAG: DNRLRE domain-containing protein [Actinobacteria bacterium]|nr:DNRLRE domain-containing protein [Actinomycetota bacterium]
MISHLKKEALSYITAAILSLLLFSEPLLFSIPVAYAIDAATTSALPSEQPLPPSETTSTPKPQKEPKIVEEIVRKRTQTSKTYLMSDGTFQAKIYSGPIHFKGDMGKWEDIDNTLIETPDGNGYTNKANSFKVFLPKINIDKAYFEVNGKSVSFFLPDGLSPFALVLGESAYYVSATGGPDIFYSVTSTGLKETIVIPNKEAAKNLSYSLDLSGLSYRQEKDKEVSFIDKKTGELAFHMTKPYMIDSSKDATASIGEPSFSEDITQSITSVRESLFVEMMPSASWLNDSKRVYPVYIDPTLTLNPSADTYVSERYPTSNYSVGTTLYSGFDDRQKNNYSLIKFDVSLLNGYIIDTATLSMYASGVAQPSSTPEYLNRITSSWDKSTVTWNTRPVSESLTNTRTPQGLQNGWLSFDVKSAVQNYLSGVWTNYGFLLHEDTTIAVGPFLAWESTSSAWARHKFASGRFNPDSYMDAVSLYDNGDGTVSILVFPSNGSSLSGPNVWYTSAPGELNWSSSKVVTGDFDGNGRSDVLILYNGGTNITNARLFLTNSTGTGFSSINATWWSSTSWDWNRSTPLSGDYNNDGKWDLAIVYDNGGTSTAIKVLTSTGTSFNAPATWWSDTHWAAGSAKYISEGDYGNIGGYADIVAFQGYADGQTQAMMFPSNRASFQSPRIWWDSGPGGWDWSASKFVASDVNGDRLMDAVAFKGVGASTTAGYSFVNDFSRFKNPYNFWQSAAGGWDNNNASYVGGDFTGDGTEDITAFTNAGVSATRAYYFRGEGMGLRYFLNYASSESSSNKPYLTITYSAPRAFDLVSPGNGSKTGNMPAFTWEASNNFDHYELWIDGALNKDNIPKTQTSTTPSSPLPEGSHTWYVKAVGIGSIKQSTSTWTVKIDATAPDSFTLESPPHGSTTNDTWPLFDWSDSTDTGSGLDKYQLYVDGALKVDNIPPSSTETQTASALTDGAHSWYVKAFDKAGNVRQSTESTFTVESTPMLGIQPYWEYWSYGLGDRYRASVNVANRNLIVSKDEFKVPDVKGAAIELSLYYNSVDSTTASSIAPVGGGWRFGIPTLDISRADGTLVLTEATGTRFYYGKKPDGSYARPAGLDEDIIKKADGTYEWTRSDSSTVTFSTQGNPIKVIGSSSNTTNYSYDQGKISKITYPSGRSLNFAYTTGLVDVTLNDSDTAGTELGKFSHEISQNRLVSVRNSDAHPTTFTYSDNSNLLSGIRTFASAGDQQLTTYGVAGDGSAQYVKDALGVQIAVFTAGQGYLTIADASWQSTRYNYNLHGDVTKVTDPFGSVSEYYWDGRNHLAGYRRPDGSSIRLIFNGDGTVTKGSTGTVFSAQSSAQSTQPPSSLTDVKNEANRLSDMSAPAKDAYASTYDDRGNVTANTNPVAPTFNLVENGSFERLTGGVADRWTSTGNATFSVDTGIANYGQNSVKISASVAGTNYYSNSNNAISVSPNQKLTLSANMRLSNVTVPSGTGGADYGIQFYDSSNNLIIAGTAYSLAWAGTGNYSQPVIATAPSNAVTAVVALRLMNATGDVWFDGVQLESPIISGEDYALTLFDYVENSSFESATSGSTNYWTASPSGASLDTSEMWSGAKSAKLSLESSGSASYTSAKIGVTGGEDMALSGSIKTQSVIGDNVYWGQGAIQGAPPYPRYYKGGVRIEINYRDANDNNLGTYATAMVSGDTGWKRYIVRTIAPNGARWAYVSAQMHSAVGSAWFDNVKLTRTEITSYTYDSFDRVTSQIDPLGNTAFHEYDSLGRETTTTDFSGNVTRRAYNSQDNLTSFTDAKGNTSWYNYDWLGRLVKVRDARTASAIDAVYGNIARVSVSSSGAQANGASEYTPSISADGRYVSFSSAANNLVPNDTNNTNDVFLYDRQTGTIERVSVSSTGAQGDNPGGIDNGSYLSSVSYDGRFVAFVSFFSNLVPNDTNGSPDIFVRDRAAGTTERVNISSSGEQAYDSGHSITISGHPSISADGRYVAFNSWATNLVPNDTNNSSDVFVYDRTNHTIERVSVSNSGVQGNNWSEKPVISADGRYVAFQSYANNLVPNDTNGQQDVFVYDRTNRTIERVSVSSSGAEGNGQSGNYRLSFSADGRYVAFESNASNLVPGDTNNKSDVFVHDRTNHTTERVSVSSSGEQGNDNSTNPFISADGVSVAFSSMASNLVPGDTNNAQDVFVYNRLNHTTTRISVSDSGLQGNGTSDQLVISSNGSVVAFASDASNLISGDTNGVKDVFVRYNPADLYTTNYTWTPTNNVESVTDPLKRIRRYQYSTTSQGEQVTEILPRGDQLTKKYDSLNRLTVGSSSTGPMVFAYNYNTVTGYLDSVTESNTADNTAKIYSYTYNSVGQPTSISDTVGGTISRTPYIGETENDLSITSSGDTKTYAMHKTYNVRGQVSTLTDPSGTQNTYAYDSAGRLIQVAKGGIIQAYNYDAGGRLISIIQQSRTGGRPGAYQLTYGYDKNGNITSVFRTDTGKTERFTYNELNRLMSWYDPSRDTTSTYSYDIMGNLLSVKEGTTTAQSFTYDIANQISTDTVANTGFTYDANGNLTFDGTNTYTYNAYGQLTKVERGGTVVAEYTYYYNGLRKSKKVNGVTIYFHYDNKGNLVSETNSSGVITAVYTWDNLGRPFSVTRDGATYYYELNGHGDVIGLDQGTYAYDPWGKVTSEPTSTPGADNPIRYAGYYYDKEIGLYYLKARYYSPTVKRFLSEDPVRSTNRYMYAQDNPTNAVDPDGRWWKSVHRDHTFDVARSVMQGPPDNPDWPASLVAESDYGVDFNMKPEQDYIGNTGRHFNAFWEWPSYGNPSQAGHMIEEFQFALDYAGLAQKAYALAVYAKPYSQDIYNKARAIAQEAEFESLNRLGIGLHSIQDLYAHGTGAPPFYDKHHNGWPVNPDDDTKQQNQEALMKTYADTGYWIWWYVYSAWD